MHVEVIKSDVKVSVDFNEEELGIIKSYEEELNVRSILETILLLKENKCDEGLVNEIDSLLTTLLKAIIRKLRTHHE